MNETTVPDRVPPHSLLAEQPVIGAMILSKNAIVDVYQVLQTTDFYKTKHQVISDIIMNLYSAGDSVDPLTLIGILEKIGKLGQIGGLDYVYTLTRVVPTYVNVSHHVEIMYDRATLYDLMEAETRITQLGQAFGEDDAKNLINTAHREPDRVSRRHISEDYRALKDLVPQITTEISNIEPDPNMVCAGFHDFNTGTRGLRPDQMTIIAARLEMGKSTFLPDICRYTVTHEDKIVAISSLEMSYIEIIKHLISAEAPVSLPVIGARVSSADGTQSQAYWTNTANATSRIFEKPLYIDNSVNLTMPEIRAKCRRLKYNHDLSIAAVDYLQLMEGRDSAKSHRQGVSEILRSLKLSAKKLEIPIIAVTQLNRGPGSHTDKKPMMSDLRESGSLEQDADMALLLHRPKAYSPGGRPGETDLYVVRHRNSYIGIVHLALQGALSHFVDAARMGPGNIPPREEY